MPLDIHEFEVDDANERKFAVHRVSAAEVFQVLDDEIAAFRNKKVGSGLYLLVGKTYGGRMLTIPVAPTAVEGRWRPITAWDSSPAERTRYENG